MPDVLVRIGGELVPLVLSHEVTLRSVGRPDLSEAIAQVRCQCGEITVLTNPVTLYDHDPDRADRRTWYRSTHSGPCSACTAPLDVELTYLYCDFSFTPADREVLSLEAIRERSGTLVREG